MKPAKPAKPATRRKGYHHGDLKRALLDAAMSVIEDHDVDAVKMSDLAKTVGVSSAAPFRHFPTRDALLVALAEEGAEEMVEALGNASADAPAGLDTQRAQGIAYVRFCLEHPAIFRLLSRPDVTDASEHLRNLTQVNLQHMEAVLGRRHQGTASPALARRSAGVLAAQALTYGLTKMVVDGLLGPLTPSQAETLAFELTGVLGEGLGAADEI